MEDLISIIIPVYNQTEHLQECLDSLSKQTYTNIEIIVVDDGSSPPIQSTQFRLQNAFPVQWLRQENKGAPAARNKGFAVSKGTFVLFCDADVRASSQMLEVLYRALQENHEVSYAYSDYYRGVKRFPSHSFDANLLKQNNYINTTCLIRREDFSRFDESLQRFQDWDLWLTLLERGKKGVYVPGFLYKTYMRRGGMSTWLPSFAYQFPFRYLPFFAGKVKAYEKAKQIVQKKHNLI